MSWVEASNVLRCGDATRIRNYFTTANANICSARGFTPLHAVCENNLTDSAVLVCHLLDCGADINAHDRDGWSALHSAAWTRNLNCLRVLLRRGASMEPKDLNGLTPLAMTLDRGYRECATLLLDWGAQLSLVGVDVEVPEWARTYVGGRERARMAAVVLLGSRRKHRSPVLASNAMDVIRLIAKVLWSTRGDEAWQNKPCT